MGLFKKQEQDPNILKVYSVKYLGGIPQNPKETLNIDFVITKDSFVIRDSFTAKGQKRVFGKFEDVTIPFNSIKSLNIVGRTVSAVEGILGGINSLQLNQDNNIHITYANGNNVEIIARLEMITGVTVMGQAKVCNELMDLLRSQNILSQFAKKENSKTKDEDDIPRKLEKLSDLLNKNIITQEDYDKKKQELLDKM